MNPVHVSSVAFSPLAGRAEELSRLPENPRILKTGWPILYHPSYVSH
jgi:hypothetical protein